MYLDSGVHDENKQTKFAYCALLGGDIYEINIIETMVWDYLSGMSVKTA